MATFTNPDTVHRASSGAIAPATWGDTVNDDINFLYGDVAWTAVSYQNGWVDFGAPDLTVAFRLIGTRVVLRGTMKSGTMSATAFTLPVGYRPTAGLNVPCVSNSAFGFVNIASNGNVTASAGSNVFMSLDGITFDTI